MSNQDKVELKPDRYFTPQAKIPVETYTTSIYEATPTPESVVFKKTSSVPKNESCCLACLLACFLCFAVKGEDEKH